VTAPQDMRSTDRVRKATPPFTLSPSIGPSGNYDIDPPRSRISFVTRSSLVGKVRGLFREFSGTGYFDAEDPTRSHLAVSISAASISTRIARRDAHLRSDAYLAVEKHPTIRFVSTAVERSSGPKYRVTGNLTMKGISKPITLDVKVAPQSKDASSTDRLVIEGTGVLARQDWDVKWIAVLEGGGAFVGKKVTIDFEVTAVRTSEVA
jgi:polyisoprenoid-binding protein YceI